MKKLFLTAIFLLLSLSSYSKVLVVSDLDDTIKVAGVGDSVELLKNYATGVEPFPHLISLYHDIKSHYNQQGEEVQFVYLTSAPRIVNSAKWLRNNNVPNGILIQRDNTDLINPFGETSKEYKIRSLTEVIASDDYSEIYLFGDNGENDPVVYSTVTNALGIQDVSNIFIRDITARATVCHEGLRNIEYFISELSLVVGRFDKIASPSLVRDLEQGIADGNLIPDFVLDRYFENRRNNCQEE